MEDEQQPPPEAALAASSRPQQFSLVLDDIPVDFPFEPYPTQVHFMRAVIAALTEGSNGLLESPTGTGKTLCMLCATLAWVQHQQQTHKGAFMGSGSGTSLRPLAFLPGGGGDAPRKAKPYRILYLSRTHAQLAQVMREFKRTAYAETVKSCILGSREHMCVNRQVAQLPTPQAQSSACNSLRAERECRYFKGIHEYANSEAQQRALGYQREVRDIEDLCKTGRARHFCPYFHQRMIAEDADIVFLPYSYVTDSALRKQLPFLVDDCIVIMDEGHNIPSLLTSSGSHKLTAGDLATAINDASRAISVLREEIRTGDAAADAMRQVELHHREEDFAALKVVLLRLEEAICAMEFSPRNDSAARRGGDGAFGSSSAMELVKAGSYMLTFLAQLHVTKDEMLNADGIKSGGLASIIDQATIVLAQTENGSRGLVAVQAFLTSVFSLDLPVDLLDLSCRFVLLGEEPKRASANGPQKHHVGLLQPPPGELRRTIGFWVLDSSSVLQAAIAGSRCVLVTSGTLSPMDHFAVELGIPFGVVHQGGHVIDDNQLFSSVLSRGPGGQRLNGSYSFRNNRDYRFALGISIVNIARNVPGGMLVFFPSYVAMSGALDSWKTDVSNGDSLTIWGMLCDSKAIFVEPPEAKELPPIIRGYQTAADESKGAMLFAVCRGKVSEGIDFADRHGRCVIVTGIPYANHSDLFVRLKREYITSMAERRPKVRGKLFTGDDWYRTEALRAVNQCVGRVIRHRHDYGAIVLADERFAQQKESISPWIARTMHTHDEFRQTYSGVAQFFAAHRPDHGQRRVAEVVGEEAVASTDDQHHMSISPPQSLQVAKAKQFVEERNREHLAEQLAAAQQVAGGTSAVPAAGARKDVLALHLPAFTGLQKQVLTIQPTRVSPVFPVSAPAMAAQPMHTTYTTNATTSASNTRPAPLPLEDDAVQRVGPEAVGNGSGALSSKQLCALLKSELPAESYALFRTVIGDIAKLHSASVSVEERKARLAELFDKARGIFGLLPEELAAQTTMDFGCHIPEAFRKYYQQLNRKRQRTAE